MLKIQKLAIIWDFFYFILLLEFRRRAWLAVVVGQVVCHLLDDAGGLARLNRVVVNAEDER